MKGKLTGPIPRWWRTNDYNIGFQHHTSQSANVLWKFLLDQTDKHKSTFRVWHTKHLMIVWETYHDEPESEGE